MAKQIQRQKSEKTEINTLILKREIFSSKKMAHGNQQVILKDRKVTKAKMVQTERMVVTEQMVQTEPMESPEQLGQQVMTDATEKMDNHQLLR